MLIGQNSYRVMSHDYFSLTKFLVIIQFREMLVIPQCHMKDTFVYMTIVYIIPINNEVNI